MVLLTCERDERFWCEGGGTEFGSADLRRGRVVLVRRGRNGVWLRRVTWMANRVGAKASLPLEEKKDWDGVVVNL